MTNSKVHFIRNDVKNLQSSKKLLKLIEFLKYKLESNYLELESIVSAGNTLFLMTKMSGMMILKFKSFFNMVHLTPVAF